MTLYHETDLTRVELLPELTVVKGSEELSAGKVFRLQKDRIVVGSVVSAEVRLPSDLVAPIHAVIEVDRTNSKSPEVTVYDLASKTGLLVNKKKVVTQKLKKGDELTIGPYLLSFSWTKVSLISPKEWLQSTKGKKVLLDPDEKLDALLFEEEHRIFEIFDYRPTFKPAVEVVMSWADTILDVQHHVDKNKVMVGESVQNDFAIPPGLPSPRFEFISRERDEEVAVKLAPGMKGIIQRQGELQDINALADQGAENIYIRKNDFAKISIGEIDFYVSFTAAPPKLKHTRLERDPFFSKVVLSSFVISLLVIFSLVKARPVKTLEPEKLPKRLVAILYAPEKYSPPIKLKEVKSEKKVEEPKPVVEQKTKPPKPVPKPEIKPQEKKVVEVKPETPPKRVKVEITPKLKEVTKPIPKEMKIGQGKESKAGGPTKSSSGEGSKTAKTSAPLKAGKRGKTETRSKTAATGTGVRSQSNDSGNLSALKGASQRIQNLLGGSSARLGSAGSKLKSVGGFDEGTGSGLSLSGEGLGKGGTADSLRGTGKRGRGTGRIGVGLGAAGSPSKILGGKNRIAIKEGGPEEVVVMGGLDPEAIEAAMLRHKDEFRLCYEREINSGNPDLSGRVTVSFEIGPRGRVTQKAGIASSSLNNVDVHGCLLSVIRRIEFPIPVGGTFVEVKYPFKFRPQG